MMNLADLEQRVAAHHTRVEVAETSSLRTAQLTGSPRHRSDSGRGILARLASSIDALRGPIPFLQPAHSK